MGMVYNKSKERFETAKKGKCPRCKGFGGVFGEDDDGKCYLCRGEGELWISTLGTGWTRADHQRASESRLY